MMLLVHDWPAPTVKHWNSCYTRQARFVDILQIFGMRFAEHTLGAFVHGTRARST